MMQALNRQQPVMTLTQVATGITGYEELGETHALSMLLTVSWWIVEAYDYRHGSYGLLIHDIHGNAIAFFSSLAELDALSALTEFCLDIISYWPHCCELIEQCRAIWWMAQTMNAQQIMREEAQA